LTRPANHLWAAETRKFELAATRAHASGSPSARVERSLLDLDPELGRLLSRERYATARAEIKVRVHRRVVGPWPATAMPALATHHLGLLVLDGVIASDVMLENVVSTELLGAGDILRPWPVDDPERMLGEETGWMVLAECRLAALDQRSAAALGHFPEVYAVLIERLDRRSRRLARTQAIAELNRVERRVLAMLWHLAERWGRVTTDGILIPLNISHRLLAQLIGARRPTVSTAVGHLSREGRVQRRPDGAWIVRGEPDGASSPTERILSRRRLLTDPRSTDLEESCVDDLELRLRRLRRETAALTTELDERRASKAEGA
jgi:CRP/FNR family cyclic AMP-dependent transcriptional regulator